MIDKKKAAGVCAPSGSLVTSPGAENHSIAPEPALATGNVITVIEDENRSLGKQFNFTEAGQVEKKAVVTTTIARAVQHRVDTHEEFATLLREVGEKPRAALINAGFKGIPLGQEFLIVSEKQLARILKVEDGDRSKLIGVHKKKYKEEPIFICGRFKENVFPSVWQLLDRDIDAHTPAEYSATMDFEQWRSALDTILPGIATTTLISAASTSARVFDTFADDSVGQGNGHYWIKVSNPNDVERTRTAIMARAITEGRAWLKPRHTSETGAVLAQSWTTLIDSSVWTPGRIVFVGKPTVGDGLDVRPQLVEIIDGTNDVLDTSLAVLPEKRILEKVSSNRGVRVTLHDAAGAVTTQQFDLFLQMELETKQYGTRLVAEALNFGGKVPCQTPFRASKSFAGFLSRGADGRPFIHDVGTSTNHWLCDEDWRQLQSKAASDKLLEEFPDDLGSDEEWFEGAVTEEPEEVVQKESAFEEQADGSATLRTYSLRELMNLPPPRWLIKDVLVRDSMALVYGQSSAGKTFVVLDMALALARGSNEWFGRKAKTGSVLYFAAEGHRGLINRLKAYCQDHGVNPDAVKTRFVCTPISLLEESNVDLAIDTIKALRKQNKGVSLIVIDTLAMTMVGGDENSSADMGEYLEAAKRLQAASRACVLFIHHSGKDEGRGARGSSALRAAVDTEILIKNENGGVRTMTITKQRDGESGITFGYELKVVKIDVDEDLNDVTSCVVVQTSVPTKDSVPAALGKVQKVVWETFNVLVGLEEEVDKETLIAESASKIHAPIDKKRDRAKEALKGLLGKGLLAEDGEKISKPF